MQTEEMRHAGATRHHRLALALTCWATSCSTQRHPTTEPIPIASSTTESARDTRPAPVARPESHETAGAASPESHPETEPARNDVQATGGASEHPVPVRAVVRGIGMHVGGGPNDAATKAPFAAAIDAKAEDFRLCYSKIDSPGARGTFGIDLLVPAEGGHPATSNVRTALPGNAFRECMITAFESVEFARPKRGRTKLSYALRLEPSEK